MEHIIILSLLFFVIALVYSSAGFGGGSSYLAVLSLFPLSFSDIRMIALVCNIAVVVSSVWLFHQNDKVKWRAIFPIILVSIPLAYLGGQYRIEEDLFFTLLGVTLLLASVIMLMDNKNHLVKLPRFFNGIIGGGIGFLSGLVGIGGGIFLSPLLHLTRWDTPKIIASTSAVFILVNSIAGLLGQMSLYGLHVEIIPLAFLVLAVVVGGQIGVRLTIFRFNALLVRRITGVVILFVSLRIIMRHFL